MEFFKKYFNNSWKEYDTGELEVLCPFPHYNELGYEYYETHPSAHINQDKSLFHCKVCGQGMSEASFLSKLQGISYKDALVLLSDMAKSDSFTASRSGFLSSGPTQQKWLDMGLSLNLADTLHIGYQGGGIEFPVYVYGELLDIRTYEADKKPKVRSLRGAKTLIYPFDIWREDDRPTLLCAGEKDMAIAREKGFNAITFTGGEQAFPKLFKASFKNKKIYIVYDNDSAGQQGSRKIATMLKDCGAVPHVVTGHYQVCTEKGEDIHDFFQKYKRTREDLQGILDGTPEWTEEEHREEQQKLIPLVSIEEATRGQYANRLVSSRVSVVATYDEAYHVPEFVEWKKTAVGDNCTIDLHKTGTWDLHEDNMKDILLLMDSNLKAQDINRNLKMLMGIPPKELFIQMTTKAKMNIFKAVVTDDLESEVVSSEDSTNIRELVVYSIGKPFRPGQKYRIYYKPVAHPLKGQQVVAIANRLEESDNSVNRFKVTDSVLDSLKVFQVKEGETVDQKMQELFERGKGIIGVEARKDITYATDLYFHTPLEFYMGKRKERAYLDVMIVGAERTGKSQAAKKLLEWYQLGLITSLKTATVAGLLGGSDQTGGGGFKTKLGLLPRNHKGAVVLEEFSGGGQDMISKLTEVRSSNVARITRVNGSVSVPCMVRMLSISNPKTRPDGTSIPLSSYPHGIQVLLELVGASEDIARYDYFLLVNEPTGYTSPLETYDLEPYPQESYQNRIRWVWSRKPEQVVLDGEVASFIVEQAEDLNKRYNSHIKLFGAEAWKKLSRVAIATAGLLCSMDEEGQKLVVTKEHVTWAKKFLISCYDNQTFKLQQYVDIQNMYTNCDEFAVAALQNIYNTNSIALKQLEMATDMSRKQLEAIAGMDNKEFNQFTSSMVKHGFVIPSGEKLQPTIRFRKAMREVGPNYMRKIGEV